ncbi:OLC1v1015234C1 [Oldenlandia corymbosa var. corymbosa]|uniref:OLC1v1015234C1 n=1 Tax=Oldenlandia corymbosa var. corymbosa TaxID=529605 RepID=A0AAV1E4Z8_OLDCO|nr:OLC1v1015234C1 [Oldenlandia corymbosa var. corymbosa]
MDLRGSPAIHSHRQQQQEARIEGSMLYRTKAENPFLDDDAFQVEDPLCKLNLKETSEFVKSLPKNCSSSSSSSSILFDISSGVQRRREFSNGGSNYYYSLSTRRNSVAEAAPPTPGRPVFSFSSTKGLSSKWEDAEKWLISTTNTTTHGHHHHDSPASSSSSSAHYHHYNHHGLRPPPLLEFASTNSRANNVVSGFSNEGSSQADLLLLKDKFTNHEAADYNKYHFSTTANFKSSSSSEPMKQAFFFGNAAAEREKPVLKNAATESISVVVVNEVKKQQQQQLRDIGTEMTPLGSSKTSRCPTPFMSTSPARYNTPENRSGPLAITTQIEECHFAKLSSNYYWSSREEEEEEISKSLRHFELNDDNDHSDDDECKKKKDNICDNRSCGWVEEQKGEDDKTNCCLRYQREEAKIQAWVNLQRAKAEAQSRKLEVKIEKMRSNLEEKLMKKMAVVHRKAEEMRAAYRLQHLEQVQKKPNLNSSNHNNNSLKNAPKMMISSNRNSLITCSYFTKQPSNHSTCGCFPCSTINQFY